MVKLQTKTITPTSSVQVVDPDTGYDGFSQVTVGAGGGMINNQNKTVDPSTSQQSITADSGYTGLGTVTINAMPVMTLPTSAAASATSGYTSKATISRSTSDQYINIPTGYNSAGGYYKINAVANGSATAPSTISGTSAMITTGTNTITLTKTVSVTPTVSAGYVSSGTAGDSSVTLTASVTVNPTPTASGATVTIPAGYYSTQAIKSVANGTAGTPTATKGTVSNHSISITPSVTNTTGYITGSTINGTAVNVSASELVSGSQTITTNDTYDVTNLASITVNVSGGGGGTSGLTVDTATATLSSAATSISFTGLAGEPTSFAVVSAAELATGASPWKTAAVVFDGTDLHGQTIRNTSNAQVTYDGSSFSKTYSNGTLTITGSGTNFQANQYKLVYTYGGSDIGTANVQVGSGATSITFTGLEEEPSYFSCIFKSNFSTSSGYQRVIVVVYDGTSVYGMEMDSSAKPSTAHWSYTYNNGSLTITSQGTNAGGYFHQPGYYQLTYATEGGGSGDTINLQEKTNINPTTSSQTITADAGYDGLSSVQINAMPTMTLPTSAASSATSGYTSKATIGRSTSAQYINIPTGYNSTGAYYTISATPNGSATGPSSLSGTSATVSTGTNTITLTKTGVTTTPTVSAGYVSSATASTATVTLTASVTTKAAATITPTTTNQTIAAGTYLTGIQTIAGDADLVGGNILSTANIFGVQGQVVVQNYYTGSSAPSSSTGSNGDLYLQS